MKATTRRGAAILAAGLLATLGLAACNNTSPEPAMTPSSSDSTMEQGAMSGEPSTDTGSMGNTPSMSKDGSMKSEGSTSSSGSMESPDSMKNEGSMDNGSSN